MTTTSIIHRSQPCNCGCKGRDPLHAMRLRRVVRNVVELTRGIGASGEPSALLYGEITLGDVSVVVTSVVRGALRIDNAKRANDSEMGKRTRASITWHYNPLKQSTLDLDESAASFRSVIGKPAPPEPTSTTPAPTTTHYAGALHEDTPACRAPIYADETVFTSVLADVSCVECTRILAPLTSYDVSEKPFTVSGPAGIVSLPATLPPNAPAHPPTHPTRFASPAVTERVLVAFVTAARAIEHDAIDSQREHPNERVRITGTSLGLLQRALNAYDEVVEGGP